MKHIERIIAGVLALIAFVTIYGIVAKSAYWHIGTLIIEIVMMAVVLFGNSESEAKHE